VLRLCLVPAALQHGQARVPRKWRVGPRPLAHPERASSAWDRARVLAGRAEPYLHGSDPCASADGAGSRWVS